MLPEKVILVKLFPTVLARVLLHLVNLPHMLLEAVLVGKLGAAHLALSLRVTGPTEPLVVDLFVSLQMSLPGEVLVTEITPVNYYHRHHHYHYHHHSPERPLPRVAQLVSLQATGSGEGLVTADVAAGVEVGAGRAGGDPQSMIIITIMIIIIIVTAGGEPQSMIIIIIIMIMIIFIVGTAEGKPKRPRVTGLVSVCCGLHVLHLEAENDLQCHIGFFGETHLIFLIVLTDSVNHSHRSL